MTRTLWRIATDTKTYEADDLTGTGAKITGGRWNAPGDALIYTSETPSLAYLETIVHLNAGGLPLNRYLVAIAVPDEVWNRAQTQTAATLPVGWDATPAGRASLTVGTTWIRSRPSALLRVPSALASEDYNVLINPLHPDTKAVTATKIRKWLYDPRLVRSA